MSNSYAVKQKGSEIGLFLAVIAASVVLIFKVGVVGVALIPAFFVGAMLVKRPDIVFILACVSGLSMVKIPFGFISSIPLPTLLMGYFVAIMLLGRAMRRNTQSRLRAEDICLLVFIGNLLLVASIRGFGFFALGSSVIGGLHYVKIIIACLFFILAGDVKLSRKQVGFLFWGMLMATLLPFFAEFLAVRTYGAMTYLARFFDFTVFRVSMALVAEEGARYETSIVPAYLLLVGGFCLGPFFGKKTNWTLSILFAGIAASIILISGFRRYVPLIGLSVFGMGFAITKSRPRYVAICAGVACISYVLLYLTVESLPYYVQRSLVIVPGLPVDESAFAETLNSNEWRLEMLELCLQELKKHWLIGKGLLLTLDETIQTYTLSRRDLYYNFKVHSYHSGAVELLVDLGVAGFLSFVGFCFFTLKKAFAVVFNKFERDGYVYCVLIGLAVLSASRLSAYFISQGQIKKYIIEYMIVMTLIKIYYNTLVKSREDRDVTTEDDDAATPARHIPVRTQRWRGLQKPD